MRQKIINLFVLRSCPDTKSELAPPLVSVASSGGGERRNGPEWCRAIGAEGARKGGLWRGNNGGCPNVWALDEVFGWVGHVRA